MPTNFVARGVSFLPSRRKWPRVIVVEDPEEPGVLRIPGGTVEVKEAGELIKRPYPESPEEVLRREWTQEVGDPDGTFDISPLGFGERDIRAIPQDRGRGRFFLYLFKVKRSDPERLPLKKNKDPRKLKDYREIPHLVSVDEPRIKSTHRVLLCLVLPKFGYGELPLSWKEAVDLAKIKSDLRLADESTSV